MNFKFFWPYNSSLSQDDQHLQFFSKQFLDSYRVYQDVPPESKKLINFNEYTLVDAESLVATIDKHSILGIANFFELPCFLDEAEEDCMVQYAACAQSVMSSEVRSEFQKIKGAKSKRTTIHGRYGDLIDGTFKQHVPRTKYVNTLAYRKFIEAPNNRGKDLCFLSDSPLVVEGLEQLSNRGLRSQYFSVQMLDLFGKDYQDFVDLFIMANSDVILAPKLSAFSILASRISGISITDFQTTLNRDSAFKLTDSEIERHYKSFGVEIRDALKSRDLINLLQNHWMDLRFTRVHGLAKKAYFADSDYVYAACVWSVILFLLGDSKCASKVLISAEENARSASSVHDDPLAVLLITKFCISIFESGKIDDQATQELASLKTYQFSTVLALAYFDTWKRKFDLKRERKHKNDVLQIIYVAFRQIKNLVPRKIRFYWLWKHAQRKETHDVLFSFLDMLIDV